MGAAAFKDGAEEGRFPRGEEGSFLNGEWLCGMEEKYEVIEERENCTAKGSRLVLLNSAWYVRLEIENKKKKKKEEEKVVVVVVVVKKEEEKKLEEEEKEEEEEAEGKEEGKEEGLKKEGGSFVLLLLWKKRRRRRTSVRCRLGILHSKDQLNDKYRVRGVGGGERGEGRGEGGGEGRGRPEGGASAFRMTACCCCRDIDDDTSCFEDRSPSSFFTDLKMKKETDRIPVNFART